jgi:hypothetical protein
MLVDPNALAQDLDKLEAIEKTSLRLVTQAIYDYRPLAEEIFSQEADLVADIGEDITREALDRLGTSRIDRRLFGKVDYKRARYLFLPEFAVKQALFVDSKAEAASARDVARLQTSQISMTVMQVRAGRKITEPGKLPSILNFGGELFLTTIIFVKYNYIETKHRKQLHSTTIAALPNGLLQARYNPDHSHGIWTAGPNAPSRGEAFRVRLSFSRLRRIANWRVQEIPSLPKPFVWQD